MVRKRMNHIQYIQLSVQFLTHSFINKIKKFRLSCIIYIIYIKKYLKTELFQEKNVRNTYVSETIYY